jgi:hypothetical protein
MSLAITSRARARRTLGSALAWTRRVRVMVSAASVGQTRRHHGAAQWAAAGHSPLKQGGLAGRKAGIKLPTSAKASRGKIKDLSDQRGVHQVESQRHQGESGPVTAVQHNAQNPTGVSTNLLRLQFNTMCKPPASRTQDPTMPKLRPPSMRASSPLSSAMDAGRQVCILTSVWPTMVADTACCITLEFIAAADAVQHNAHDRRPAQAARSRGPEIIVPDWILDWICILLPCSKQRATNAHPVPIRDVRPTTPGPPNTLKVRATQTTEVEVWPSL